MRILLVEDHARFGGHIKEGLQKADFTVDLFGTATSADDAMSTVKFDAVVLDLGLPDMDGLQLLKSWRKNGNKTPVLILTARDDISDKVKGLNGGGDDYMLKPFAMEELIARLRALLRRPEGVLGTVLKSGNLAFDTAGREVSINDKPVNFSRREMAVLEQLMRRFGRVVPKDVLEDKIYGFDQEVSSNSVEVHISRLRKRLKLGAASVSVHTLRGVGYLLSETQD